MALPELGAARVAVEALMVDHGVLRRDAEGRTDDVVDRTNAKIKRRTNEPTTVYDGACQIKEPSRQNRSGAGPGHSTEKEWEVAIPWDAPLPHVNDEFEIVASQDDPGLVDKKVTVVDVTTKTIRVSRKFLVRERVRA